MLSPVRIAIIDLYNNEPNQGMRCIQELIEQVDKEFFDVPIGYQVFETRFRREAPDPDAFDIFISSGGPGSPFDGAGQAWESDYFDVIDRVWNHNERSADRHQRKHIFFICHSFQMMVRYFKLANVQRRARQSFGIIPVERTGAGRDDVLLQDLPGTYFAADFRQFEVVEPRQRAFDEIGARIVSREKYRRFASDEKAMMAIRISDEIFGTQFHPEADPRSMLYHFQQPERKRQVVQEYGLAKYDEMLAHLRDPENILLTRRMILPRFLSQAAWTLRPDAHIDENFRTDRLPGECGAAGEGEAVSQAS